MSALPPPDELACAKIGLMLDLMPRIRRPKSLSRTPYAIFMAFWPRAGRQIRPPRAHRPSFAASAGAGRQRQWPGCNERPELAAAPGPSHRAPARNTRLARVGPADRAVALRLCRSSSMCCPTIMGIAGKSVCSPRSSRAVSASRIGSVQARGRGGLLTIAIGGSKLAGTSCTAPPIAKSSCSTAPTSGRPTCSPSRPGRARHMSIAANPRLVGERQVVRWRSTPGTPTIARSGASYEHEFPWMAFASRDREAVGIDAGTSMPREHGKRSCPVPDAAVRAGTA